ncbi:hypothetical protein ACUODF_44310, partial [Escherichia coli]
MYNTISSLASHVFERIYHRFPSFILINKEWGKQTSRVCLSRSTRIFIDQDEGWKAVINSFENMSMYSEWQKNILYYHSGIKPKEYYTVQGKIKEIKVKISELDGFVKVLKRSKSKLDES